MKDPIDDVFENGPDIGLLTASSAGASYFTIAVPDPEDYTLSFQDCDGKPYLTIWPSAEPKRMWIHPDLTADEAAPKFWDAVRDAWGIGPQPKAEAA